MVWISRDALADTKAREQALSDQVQELQRSLRVVEEDATARVAAVRQEMSRQQAVHDADVSRIKVSDFKD